MNRVMQIDDQRDAGYVADKDEVVAALHSCWPDFIVEASQVEMAGDEADKTWSVPIPPGMAWVWDDNPEGTSTTCSSTIGQHDFLMLFRPQHAR